MKPDGFDKKLKNGIHWTDVKTEHVSAMFVVPTPTVDDSGIAHLCEHLVFRTSAAFPEAHNLFACTSLTPCKINASSCNNESLFYATAPEANTLARLIHYLYAGLQNLEYSEMELSQERDGVIFQELTFLEAQPEYQNMIRMWRDDSRLHKYYHWGGYTDTVPHIGLKDVLAYKQEYFKPEFIQLYTSGIAEDLLEATLARTTSIGSVTAARKITSTQAEFAPITDTYFPKHYKYQRSNIQLLSWWLPAELHNFCLDNLPRLRKQFPDLWVEQHLNQNQKFAIRTTQTDWQNIAQTIANIIHDEYSLLVTTKEIESKYPLAIQSLLEAKDTQEVKHLSFSSWSLSYNVLSRQPSLSTLGNLPSYEAPRVPSQRTPLTRASLLADWPYPLSLKHAVPPKHIVNLLNDAQHLASCPLLEAPYIQDHDWVMQVSVDLESLHAILLESEFWLPRTVGDCYAMGVFTLNEHIYVWGVADNLAEQRGQWVATIFNQNDSL